MTRLPPGAALAGALERGRERFNQRVAMARRQGARIEAAALFDHLVRAVAPSVDAVAGVDPGRVDAVAEVLFDLSLDLLGREIVGPAGRHPSVVAAWEGLLPKLAPQLAEEPRRVAAAVSNAAYNLELEPAARAAEWLDAMGAIAGTCRSAAQLLECGKVLAWRSGLAHYRASALRAWESLPDLLARATLGLAPGASIGREELRSALADPWRVPGSPARTPSLRVVGFVGGFRGFGGPFLVQPRVFAARGGLWAVEGERAWAIHADCFGRTLVPAPPPAEEDRSAASLAEDGTVRLAGLEARLSGLAGASGFAATENLLAVTLPRSYRIPLVARTWEVA